CARRGGEREACEARGGEREEPAACAERGAHVAHDEPPRAVLSRLSPVLSLSQPFAGGGSRRHGRHGRAFVNAARSSFIPRKGTDTADVQLWFVARDAPARE